MNYRGLQVLLVAVDVVEVDVATELLGDVDKDEPLVDVDDDELIVDVEVVEEHPVVEHVVEESTPVVQPHSAATRPASRLSPNIDLSRRMVIIPSIVVVSPNSKSVGLPGDGKRYQLPADHTKPVGNLALHILHAVRSGKLL